MPTQPAAAHRWKIARTEQWDSENRGGSLTVDSVGPRADNSQCGCWSSPLTAFQWQMTPTRVPPNEEGLPTSLGEPPKGPVGKPSQDRSRSNFFFVEDKTNVVSHECNDEPTDIRLAALRLTLSKLVQVRNQGGCVLEMISDHVPATHEGQAKHGLSGIGLTIEAEREPVGDLGTLGADESPR